MMNRKFGRVCDIIGLPLTLSPKRIQPFAPDRSKIRFAGIGKMQPAEANWRLGRSCIR